RATASRQTTRGVSALDTCKVRRPAPTAKTAPRRGRRGDAALLTSGGLQAELQDPIVDLSMITVRNEAVEVGILATSYPVDPPGLQTGLVDELVSVEAPVERVVVVEQPQPLRPCRPREQPLVEGPLIRVPPRPATAAVVLQSGGPARQLPPDVVDRRHSEDLPPRRRERRVEHHVDLTPFESIVAVDDEEARVERLDRIVEVAGA